MKKILRANILRIFLLILVIIMCIAEIAGPIVINALYNKSEIEIFNKIKNIIPLCILAFYMMTLPLTIILWRLERIFSLFSKEGYSLKKIATNFTIISILFGVDFVFSIVIIVFSFISLKAYSLFGYILTIGIIITIIYLMLALFNGVLASVFGTINKTFLESSEE